MKPLKLSKKLNPLGEIMNLPDAFKQIKKTKHDSSFENLGDWLANNNSKPKKMKTFYKIAASLIFATMILIACTVPVQHEEEIGYMIKGIATSESVSLKSKLAQFPSIDPSQLSISEIIHEEIGAGEETIERVEEIVMILPEANYKAAKDKKATLAGMFNFKSLEILPIEETVERTVFESALHTLDIKVKDEISDLKVANRINTFLHENSNAKGDAKVLTDKDGNRFVVLEVGIDKNSGAATKRSIKSLVNELTPEENKVLHRNMSETEIIELKERESEKKQLLEKRKNN